jgi:hypothetical protein
MPAYDATDAAAVKKCSKTTFAQLTSLLFLENSDQKKYGSLLKGLSAQQSLGNNQYPRSITKASEVLSEHPFDKPNGKSAEGRQNNNRHNNGKEQAKKETKSDDPMNLSFAQMEGKCYKCGKPGHKSPECKVNQPDINKWAINVAKLGNKSTGQGQSHAQVNNETEAAGNTNVPASLGSTSEITNTSFTIQGNKDRTVGWAGVHAANLSFFQTDKQGHQHKVLVQSRSSY